MKRVIITGVSRGIGKATAEKFLDEGWYVIGTSTSGKNSMKYPHLHMLKLDYLDPHTIQNLTKAIAESGGFIDVLILINNAAILLTDHDRFPLDTNVLRKTLDVNLIGIIELTQRLLPHIKDGGSIINLSSGLGSLIENYGSTPPAYKIAKAGINMFTRALAQELEDRDISVSSIDPGWVKTDMGGKGAHRDPSEPANEIYKLATSNVESGNFWLRGKKRSW